MKELICIVCPKGCHLKVDEENGFAVTGNACPRGAEYGKMELTHPTRVVTSTVRCAGGLYPRCPVKTDRPVPKGEIFQVMAALEVVELSAPVRAGQVVVENVCGTGANVVATRDMI
jgi:CxxC motif-containing protein